MTACFQLIESQPRGMSSGINICMCVYICVYLCVALAPIPGGQRLAGSGDCGWERCLDPRGAWEMANSHSSAKNWFCRLNEQMKE